jgi:hypothetical protein
VLTPGRARRLGFGLVDWATGRDGSALSGSSDSEPKSVRTQPEAAEHAQFTEGASRLPWLEATPLYHNALPPF